MRLLFAAIFLGAAPLASAQQSEVFIQQAEQAIGAPAETLAGTAAGLALSDAVLEAGVGANVAVVSQQGSDNSVDLVQDGAGNQFSLSVVGQGNDLALRQLGDDNRFVGQVVGDGNVLVGPDAVSAGSVQEGGGNVYELLLDGVSGTGHTIRQLGGDNTAFQAVGAGMQPASIEQLGGATVTVVRR